MIGVPSPQARLCLSLVLVILPLAAFNHEVMPDSALFYAQAMPRALMALLAGGALALAGAVMQQTLSNPLATPATLGVVSGAQFALLAATVALPGALVLGRELVASVGAGLAMTLVIGLAWRQRLAPVAVVLAGIVINLYLGALSTALLLLYQEELYGIMIWGAGSLAQTSWVDVTSLGVQVLVAIPLAITLFRPLDILSLGDAQAQSLGVRLAWLRLAALALAVLLAALVTSTVGVMGLVGLAAPVSVRLLGVRSFGRVAVWSTAVGALLLLATDLLLQIVSEYVARIVPTGAITLILGAMLLLWLLPRLRLGGKPPQANQSVSTNRSGRTPWSVLPFGIVAALAVALLSGQSLSGWHWLNPAHAATMLEWRLPRVLAAGGAGAILALAGVILQRLTRNPMASPEILGISSGAALGFIVALFTIPGASSLALALAGMGGALGGIALVIGLNSRHDFAPDLVLLTGVGVTAAAEGVQRLLLAGGDPRSQQAIAWIAGSTYHVDLTMGGIIAALAIVSVATTQPLSRWLDLLPLGTATATALGVRVNASRLILLLAVAMMTACATLIVGPLSFVGLLAPHMAHLSGWVRARAHLLGSAGIGACLMILADWLGRQILFPQELPAGLTAAIIGGTYFITRLRRL